MASVRNADLIEKMTSSDKDFRFMAINDIMESLKNKSITLDDNTENQLITNLLKLLEDTNAEVQNLDVKCIALFVNYLAQTRLFSTFDALCKKITEGEDSALRDTAAHALRSAIIDFNSLKNVSFHAMVDKVMPQLISILAKNNDTDVRETILEIVAHIFQRTGNKLDFKYDGLSDVLFKHAESEKYGVRRRAQQALALHAEVADNKLFDTIVKRVYASCQKYMDNSALMKTYVATTTAICKNSGQRFSDSLPAFTELFLQICHRSEDDELREVTIGAFETFFHRCPDAVAPFDAQISKVVIALIEYDPNYSYDDSDNEDSMEVDRQSEDEDDDDEDSDYSDDDDVSWKVRRASAKCIAAMITHGQRSLYENYVAYGKLLIKRMKEREDNVKQDIMNAYLALIRETRLLVPDNVVPLNLHLDASCIYEKISMESFNEYVAADEERKKIFTALNEQIPALIRRISSAQKTKNIKVLEHTFILLSAVVTAFPGSIGSALPQLARGIKHSLADRDGNMKLQTLRFLANFFATHDYKDYKNGVAEVLPDVLKLAGDVFAKVSFEAIEAINSLICSMANSSAPKDPKSQTDIFNLLITKFQVTDMDQEVKDKTTYGLGFFVASFGDSLGAELDKCLPLLVDRLSNEISRNSALRSLTVIARSQKNFSMNSVVPTIARYFPEFLRKTHRTLRIYTLSLAIAIAERNEPGNFDAVDLSLTYAELPQLLVDSDLQIAQLSLRLAALLLKHHPKSVGNVQPVLDAVMKLTQSPLLQGKTQKSLLEFLDVYTHAKIGKKVDFKTLVEQYMEFVAGWANYSKSAYITVAKSIATLARGSPVSAVLPLTKELEKFVMTGKNVNIKILSVLIIGELGRVYPAVYTDKSSIKPEEVAVSCFTPTCEEELKMSASQALGSLAVGNIQRFLPFILEQIKEQASRQYLLVYALRELITSDSVDSAGQQLFASNMDTIWNGILSQASSNESTRQVVSECLGKLCLMNPQKYLQELVTCFRHENPLVRSTALTAIRYMISDKSIPADAFLMKVLPKFFEGVQDENIETRRFAFVLVATVANHKPSLIRDNLDKVLPHIYVETTPRPELRYEVEMGPFKNLVDDGLELRRSAFECMYNLVEHCLDRVAFHEFLQNLEKGFNDSHDVKLLAYLTLIRLTETCPHQISKYADGLADTMKAHLQAKPKQNAVKIDNDKQDEMKRTVIRALVGLKKMQTHERLPKIDELFEWVTKDFAGLLSEVKSDPADATLSPSTSNAAVA